MSGLERFMVQPIIDAALHEDIGRGDLTTEGTIPGDRLAAARMVAKDAGCVAGLTVARWVFERVDPHLEITEHVSDGASVSPGDRLMTVEGRARSILLGERVALNFAQRLSGIATATRSAVEAAKGTKAIIVDTRKTTPGLRVLEKYAVRVGGGRNHRYGLDDAVLIKENHIAVAGGIGPAVQGAKRRLGHMHKIEVEVETLAQLDEALDAGADAVLLDNMDLETMREAVRRIKGRAAVEASGGIRPEDVRAVAETGVDVISLGWITHSAPALDLSLRVEIETP